MAHGHKVVTLKNNEDEEYVHVYDEVATGQFELRDPSTGYETEDDKVLASDYYTEQEWLEKGLNEYYV